MSGGPESKKQLGKILLQQKLVSPDDLQEMLEEQKRDPGARLASTAARRGRIAVVDALRALGEQHGVPPVDLAEIVIPLSILRLIPVEMAREHALLPFRVDGDRLLLAMSSPDRREALDEIEFVAAKKVVVHVALDHVVRHVVDYAYAQLEQGGEYYVGAHVTDEALGALGLPNLPRAPEPLTENLLPPPPSAEAASTATGSDAGAGAEAVPPGAAGAPAPVAPAVTPAAAPAAPPGAGMSPERVTGAIALPFPAGAVPSSASAATATSAAPVASTASASATAASGTASSTTTAATAVTTTAADGQVAGLDPAFGARTRPSQRPVLQAPAADARVLVAVRDAGLRLRLRALLVEQSVAYSDADDGVAALERVRAENPRLCVLDPDLPSIHGLDICRRLRASTRYASLPLLLVVDGTPSWRFVHDVRSGFGVAHVFGTPHDLPALVQTIRLLITGQSVPEEPPALGVMAEQHWSAGMKAFETGALPEAISQLEAGLALEPRAFELLYHLGLLYGRRDDLFSAIRTLELAAVVQPRHFAVLKNLAVVYQRAGMTQSAIDAWQRARTCAPDEPTAATIREHLLGLL